MLSANNKISIRQLQVLLILDIFGAGIIFLPQTVAGFAGQDSWICVLLATIVAVFLTYIIMSLAKRFPDKTFLEYSSELLTRPIGVLISVVFVIKIIISVSFELRIFGEIVRQTMLSQTPFIVICFSMLLLGGYAASKGYEARARASEILIFVAILPIIFVFAVASTDIDFTNILPVLVTSRRNILEGSYAAIFAFSGLEFCLLVYPYLHRRKSARRSAMNSIAVVGIMMTIITIVSVARFGPIELQRQMWPVIEMMDTVTLPGSFLERQGAIVMSFWIVSVFAIVNAGLFFSSLLLKDICKRGKHSNYILALIPVVYGVSMIPENTVQLFEYRSFVNNTLGIAFLFFVPLIMLIIAKIKKVGVSQ